MAKFFGNLHLVLVVGLVAAIAVMLGFGASAPLDANSVLRWLHVFFGILWIGLLYYLNFVQVPTMPAIPAEQKPSLGPAPTPPAPCPRQCTKFNCSMVPANSSICTTSKRKSKPCVPTCSRFTHSAKKWPGALGRQKQRPIGQTCVSARKCSTS